MLYLRRQKLLINKENKKVVNRPKDQIDVIELEKIRKIREEEK